MPVQAEGVKVTSIGLILIGFGFNWAYFRVGIRFVVETLLELPDNSTAEFILGRDKLSPGQLVPVGASHCVIKLTFDTECCRYCPNQIRLGDLLFDTDQRLNGC